MINYSASGIEKIRKLNKELRDRRTDHVKKDSKIVSWSEETILSSSVEAKALVFIVPTRGCYWGRSKSGGCTVCGYINDSRDHKPDNLLDEFKQAWQKRYNENESIKAVKIFNSGSFLDSSEMSWEDGIGIIKFIADHDSLNEISIESRPEFILKHPERLKEIKDSIGSIKFGIGIGLESINEYTRNVCINKNIALNDYFQAVNLLAEQDIFTKTYVLLKPPFLSEIEAIQDSINSITAAVKAGSRMISLNPCNVHSGTFTEWLWKRGLYRPPWLWSVVEILKRFPRWKGKSVIQCEPVGAGKIRGPSNCKKCNDSVLREISIASKKQDYERLNSLNCECRKKWQQELLKNEMTVPISIKL